MLAADNDDEGVGRRFSEICQTKQSLSFRKPPYLFSRLTELIKSVSLALSLTSDFKPNTTLHL